MADRGNGIRLFSTLDELVEIFEEFQDDSDSEEGEEEDGEQGRENGNKFGQGKDTSVMMSQLRHFVIQEYISKPLLVSPPPISNEPTETSLSQGSTSRTENGRKFHLRAYVLCVGGLSVYLFDDVLALFASMDYEPPDVRMENHNQDEDSNDEEESRRMVDLRRHLTNTCLQEDGTPTNDNRPEEKNVHLLDDLVDARIFCPNQERGGESNESSTYRTNRSLTSEEIERIKSKCCQTIGDTFMAAAKAGSIHWQIWPNSFEIFGVDLLVGWDEKQDDEKNGPKEELKKEKSDRDLELKVWLLEINAQPDFAQTGSRLSSVVERLFSRTFEMVVPPNDLKRDDGEEKDWKVGESRGGMTLCFKEDLGRG